MSLDDFVLIRGGGDLATGAALRLHRAGVRVLITELPHPLAVRRAVSFAEAVYEKNHRVEGVAAKLIEADQFPAWEGSGEIPVLVDPNLDLLSRHHPPVVVDARLIKHTPSPLPTQVPLHIGLGPGFHAGHNCHAVIETRRSHTLGRVIWEGTSQPDSGEPDGDPRRVLRAPIDGVVVAYTEIGDHLKEGQLIAELQPEDGNLKSKIISPFTGVLRGLIHPGLHIPRGIKIGDVDPRNDRTPCFLASDKALAIGGGVLEAVLSKREIRERLFSGH